MAQKEKRQEDKQTAPPGPVVLAINICDTVIRDESTKKVSLIGLFNVIGSSTFPCTHSSMHIYMALTGGHGNHEMEVKLVRVEDQQAVMVMRGPIEFANPLQVAEVNLRWEKVIFEKSGEYSVEVFCDGGSVPIGTRKFHVIEQGAVPPTLGSEAK